MPYSQKRFLGTGLRHLKSALEPDEGHNQNRWWLEKTSAAGTRRK
jgi:hypothetical protein